MKTLLKKYVERLEMVLGQAKRDDVWRSADSRLEKCVDDLVADLRGIDFDYLADSIEDEDHKRRTSLTGDSPEQIERRIESYKGRLELTIEDRDGPAWASGGAVHLEGGRKRHKRGRPKYYTPSQIKCVEKAVKANNGSLVDAAQALNKDLKQVRAIHDAARKRNSRLKLSRPF